MPLVKLRLEQKTLREFKRACQLRGETMSQNLRLHIIRVNREEKARHEHLFTRRTSTEKTVLAAIDDGAFQVREIASETGLSRELVESTLTKLVSDGILQAVEQAGKHEEARGFRKTLYTRAEQ
jgi:predicted Rossmann fold nucleotide-binding protein DprA/Smf involved in DNA uptake